MLRYWNSISIMNLLEKQGHKCATCGTTDPKGRKSGRGGAVDV
jgi:hypothetical protein